VKNDDVMDLIVVFCILFVFMLVLYCFCVATEFSVNKDLYIYIHQTSSCFYPSALHCFHQKSLLSARCLLHGFLVARVLTILLEFESAPLLEEEEEEEEKEVFRFNWIGCA